MAPIRIYDDTIAPTVIPRRLSTPSFRVIIDTPLTTSGDIIEVTTTVNGVAAGLPLRYVKDHASAAGQYTVGVVSLGVTDQPIAPLPTAAIQASGQWVTMSPKERARKATAEAVIEE